MSDARTEFPPGVQETIRWLQARFGRYYRENPPAPPDRFTRREFGFILWPDRPGPPPFIRHRAYTQKERLHGYMAKVGPHSAYYSTAYYRAPGEMAMVDKDWLGAELIFDLDADHLPDAASKTLEQQLAAVKVQFRYLLDEFLFGDLGIDEKDVFLTFSGGRGYHAHVTDPKVLGLDAKGRREIVDYVTAKVPAAKGTDEPDLSPFIERRPVAANFGRAQMAEFLKPAEAPGWPGRLTRTLVSALRDNVVEADPAHARTWLTSLDKIGPKKADEFMRGFDTAKLDRLGRGNLEQGAVVKQVCRRILAQAALPLSKGETDEPVTADVKRLIRLPGSLHGKTGLRVVTLGVDDLADFDPFRDATAYLLDETVGFRARDDAEVTLAGEHVKVVGGEETEVPVPHAMFWCGRQAGTVVLPS